MAQDNKKVRGWNWAAFLLTWIWGVSHKVWISLFALVPGVNFLMAIYLGMKGNELAWQENCYLSAEEFRLSQKNWLRWSIIIYFVALTFSIVILLIFGYMSHISDEMSARDAKRISDARAIVSAVNHYKSDHDKKCPDDLSELVPTYIRTLPTPDGESYRYTADNESCTVTTRLENSAADNLGDDADPTNGNIYDQKAEDLDNYIFFQE